MAGQPDKQRKRLKRWTNLQHPKMCVLVEEVLTRLVPELENLGFNLCGVPDYRKDWPPSAYEILFCRPDRCEEVEVRFSQKGLPAIFLTLRRLGEGCERQNAFVVRKHHKIRIVNDFGMRWNSLGRRDAILSKAVDQVIAILPQVIRYLNTGEGGPNIRRWNYGKLL